MEEDLGQGRGGGAGHVGDGRAGVEFTAAMVGGTGVILDDVGHRPAADAVVVRAAALGAGEEEAVGSSGVVRALTLAKTVTP